MGGLMRHVTSFDFGEEPNCATPDAMYSVDFSAAEVIVRVRLPKTGMVAMLSPYQKGLLRRRLHDAVLPSIEMIYANAWAEMFAGKGKPPYPAKHTDMHAPRPTE